MGRATPNAQQICLPSIGRSCPKGEGLLVSPLRLAIQKKKSKGSYPARQREHILAQIRTLARISVRASLVLRGDKQWQVESPLLELLPDRQREANGTCVRHEALSTCHLKIGDWAGMIPELQSRTVLMARQLLHYHARQQKYEKRERSPNEGGNFPNERGISS